MKAASDIVSKHLDRISAPAKAEQAEKRERWEALKKSDPELARAIVVISNRFGKEFAELVMNNGQVFSVKGQKK